MPLSRGPSVVGWETLVGGFRRIVVAGAAATVSAVVFAGSATATTWANGLVVSSAGVKVRAHANTSARVVGTLDPWKEVRLSCQANGQWVEGNNLWYRVHGRSGWVSARWVHNYTLVPWC
ncbi:SH3 domain-containing protein [Streptomyces sp. NPDC048603]|uniref:SH3 domain-containing protein n=1 Tax=Streptomyces sp. NPDC048603 TaxID=3365577 RepID=UPI003717B6CB